MSLKSRFEEAERIIDETNMRLALERTRGKWTSLDNLHHNEELEDYKLLVEQQTRNLSEQLIHLHSQLKQEQTQIKDTLKQKNRHIKQQKRTIRTLLLSNSSLLNVIESITYVYDIKLDCETERTVRTVSEVTYNEIMNQREPCGGEEVTMCDAETDCSLIGSDCVAGDMSATRKCSSSSSSGCKLEDMPAETAGGKATLFNGLSQKVSRFRSRDKSRSQSDLHLVCNKIPEEIEVSDNECTAASNEPGADQHGTTGSCTASSRRKSQELVEIPATKIPCKRTNSLGAISLPKRGVESKILNNKETKKSRSTSLKQNVSSHSVQSNGGEGAEEAGKPAAAEVSPKHNRSRLPQREHSFMQTFRTFLKPKDVKKKSKLRSRSESVPVGLSCESAVNAMSATDGVPSKDKKLHRRSDSFTLYVKDG